MKWTFPFFGTTFVRPEGNQSETQVSEKLSEELVDDQNTLLDKHIVETVNPPSHVATHWAIVGGCCAHTIKNAFQVYYNRPCLGA